MHGRKGFILVMTLIVSSLVLTMSLYLFTSIVKERERISLNNNMLDKGDLRDRECLLTKAYNSISLNGEDLNSIKEYLNSHSQIIKEDCGGVYYDKNKDLVYTITSFNNESYILSYYSYFKSSLSFSLIYTKLKNKYK